MGSIPGFGRSPGEGKGYPLQYSGLENSMDCIVHGVAKSWKQLSHFHFAKPIAVLFFLIKTRQFCTQRSPASSVLAREGLSHV